MDAHSSLSTLFCHHLLNFISHTSDYSFIHSFIHSIDMCTIRRFLAVLRSFFHSSLLCTFSCHPSPPTIHPSSLTSSCHLFLGLPLNLVVTKFIFNTLLGILFSFILCTCPNQCNLFNLIVCIIVDRLGGTFLLGHPVYQVKWVPHSCQILMNGVYFDIRKGFVCKHVNRSL